MDKKPIITPRTSTQVKKSATEGKKQPSISAMFKAQITRSSPRTPANSSHQTSKGKENEHIVRKNEGEGEDEDSESEDEDFPAIKVVASISASNINKRVVGGFLDFFSTFNHPHPSPRASTSTHPPPKITPTSRTRNVGREMINPSHKRLRPTEAFSSDDEGLDEMEGESQRLRKKRIQKGARGQLDLQPVRDHEGFGTIRLKEVRERTREKERRKEEMELSESEEASSGGDEHLLETRFIPQVLPHPTRKERQTPVRIDREEEEYETEPPTESESESESSDSAERESCHRLLVPRCIAPDSDGESSSSSNSNSKREEMDLEYLARRTGHDGKKGRGGDDSGFVENSSLGYPSPVSRKEMGDRIFSSQNQLTRASDESILPPPPPHHFEIAVKPLVPATQESSLPTEPSEPDTEPESSEFSLFNPPPFPSIIRQVSALVKESGEEETLLESIPDESYIIYVEEMNAKLQARRRSTILRHAIDDESMNREISTKNNDEDDEEEYTYPKKTVLPPGVFLIASDTIPFDYSLPLSRSTSTSIPTISRSPSPPPPVNPGSDLQFPDQVHEESFNSFAFSLEDYSPPVFDDDLIPETQLSTIVGKGTGMGGEGEIYEGGGGRGGRGDEEKLRELLEGLSPILSIGRSKQGRERETSLKPLEGGREANFASIIKNKGSTTTTTTNTTTTTTTKPSLKSHWELDCRAAWAGQELTPLLQKVPTAQQTTLFDHDFFAISEARNEVQEKESRGEKEVDLLARFVKGQFRKFGTKDDQKGTSRIISRARGGREEGEREAVEEEEDEVMDIDEVEIISDSDLDEKRDFGPDSTFTSPIKITTRSPAPLACFLAGISPIKPLALGTGAGGWGEFEESGRWDDGDY